MTSHLTSQPGKAYKLEEKKINLKKEKAMIISNQPMNQSLPQTLSQQ